MDLSRTVGWFTSIYPVRLQLPRRWNRRSDQIGKRATAVDSRTGHWLSVCHDTSQANGCGSRPGASKFSSTTLANSIRWWTVSRLFGFADEPTGPWHASERARRRYLIEINCLVVNGRLELWWTYSPNRHLPETIENSPGGVHLASARDH